MTKSKSKSKKSEKGKEVNNSANAGDSRVSKTCEVCLRIRWKRFLFKAAILYEILGLKTYGQMNSVNLLWVERELSIS